MIIKVLLHLLALALAHELVAPDGDYDDSGKHMDELNIIQLLTMFYSSEGVILNLPDDALSASDVYSDNHAASYARIGADQVSGMAHAWCGNKGEANEITVDMTTSFVVTGIATQGRSDNDHWVTNYLVETSEDGNNWVRHGPFRGNFDRNTICRRRIEKPVLASFVRFTVLEYFTHPCMRLDVLVHHVDDEGPDRLPL